MKVGMRKPSIKRSVKARTTGRIKRSVKRSVNPLYGKEGMGFIKNPEKALKNAVYHRTTFGVSDVARAASKATGSGKRSNPSKAVPSVLSIITILIGIVLLLASPIGIVFILLGIVILIVINKL